MGSQEDCTQGAHALVVPGVGQREVAVMEAVAMWIKEKLGSDV